MNSKSSFVRVILQLILIQVLSTFASPEVMAQQSLKCQGLFSNERAVRSSWNPEGFTDPQSYVPGQPYRFIVSRPSFDMVVNGQTHSIDEITRTISERTAFSGSLITDRNRTTYMNDVVMILKVPAENIVAVSPVDMRSILLQKVIAQSRENGQKLISQIAQLFPLATPDQLDLATSPKTYSELIIQGTSPQSGEKVAVIGWGLKTRNGQFTAPSHIIKEVMNIARANRQAILSFESDPVDLDELRRRQKMIPSIRDLVIPPTTPE